MGHSKHYLKGHPGHNRDVIQVARELNMEAQVAAEVKEKKKGRMVSSVKEAFEKK